MSQLIVGRDLPNLKICVDNAVSSEKKSSVDMEVEEKIIVNSESEDTENNPPVKININWDSVGIVPPHPTRRYVNKYAFLVSELKLTAEELQKKLEDRAERFGEQLKPRRQVSPAEIDAVYRSVNLDIENLKSSSDERGIRLEALHIHGVNEMSTGDIFDYFKDYMPAWIEWVNDVSCNVVWLEQLGAAVALLKVSRPISVRKKNDNATTEKTDVGDQNDVIVFSEDEFAEKELLPVDEIFYQDPPAVDKMVNTNMEETNPDNGENKPEEPISMPPGQWRLGMSHPKAKTLLLRFCTKDDKKIPGAEKQSDYYKKYGNPNYGGMKGLISTTKKRKIRYLKEREEVERIFGGLAQPGVAPGATKSTKDDFADTGNDSKNEEKTREHRAEAAKRPRMRMHADDEESNLRKKNGIHGRLGKRPENTLASDSSDLDLNSDLEDSNTVEPEIYRQSSVWDRLEGSSVRAGHRTDDAHDLRSHLNESSRSRSSGSGGDLRSKLQRLRNEEPESKHRSPMLKKPFEEKLVAFLKLINSSRPTL